MHLEAVNSALANSDLRLRFDAYMPPSRIDVLEDIADFPRFEKHVLDLVRTQRSYAEGSLATRSFACANIWLLLILR